MHAAPIFPSAYSVIKTGSDLPPLERLCGRVYGVAPCCVRVSSSLPVCVVCVGRGRTEHAHGQGARRSDFRPSGRDSLHSHLLTSASGRGTTRAQGAWLPLWIARAEGMVNRIVALNRGSWAVRSTRGRLWNRGRTSHQSPRFSALSTSAVNGPSPTCTHSGRKKRNKSSPSLAWLPLAERPIGLRDCLLH